MATDPTTRPGSRPIPWWAGLVAGAAGTGVAYAAAGATLGLVIGGLFVAALVVPALTSGAGSLRNLVASTAATAAGVAIVWMMLIGSGKASVGEWLEVVLIVFGFAAALSGLCSVLVRIGMAEVLAAAIVVMMGFGWLSWPVWGAGVGISSRAAGDLVWVHPGLAANGVLRFTPPWTEQTVAYGMTSLGQDVAVKLPGSGVPCAIGHGVAGVVLMGVGSWRGGRRGAPQAGALNGGGW